jgi:hypothetical protein
MVRDGREVLSVGDQGPTQEAQRGLHFDPVIVDAFVTHRREVEAIQPDATTC